MRALILTLAAVTVPAVTLSQTPSAGVRQQVLRTVVQVTASGCSDNTSRTGSGFLLETSARIVTAHHVVGGCSTVQVTYEGVSPPARRLFPARLVRVLASGDLGLLEVTNPPTLPALRLSSALVTKDASYAGFGYPLGVPTASDQPVTLAVGAARLADILPDEAAQELQRSGSRIAVKTDVLRLNVALQPGMSGGPIVDAAGDVVGVVAGGLKSGAAPVSWAWPREGVRLLLASSEAVDQRVALARIQYSLSELEQMADAQRSGRRLTCGDLEYYDSGTRTLGDLMRGADDFQRVLHIMQLSREDSHLLKQALFRVWVSAATGATAVVPDGYALSNEGNVCAANSKAGPFQLLVWGAKTPQKSDVQWRSQEFEQRVLGPRLPYQFGAEIDPQLTTFITLPNGAMMPGPQTRSNGLVFNRKGFTLAKAAMPFPGAPVPLAHGFHTLVAQSGAFMGVAALNDQIEATLQQCLVQQMSKPQCASASAHLREWTRFVLAAQLSTFPAF
jgi:S1-C subfamily serine protease